MNSQVSQDTRFVSEIFPLSYSQLNLICFRLTPEVNKQDGNRLSYRFGRKLPDLFLYWEAGYFWVLGTLDRQMPSSDEWRDVLSEIKEEVEEFSDCYFTFQWVRQPQYTPSILAKLAAEVLNTDRPFLYQTIKSKNGVDVRREPEIWAETIELNEVLQPALTISIRSSIIPKVNLYEFFQTHPYRQNTEKVLVNLKVQKLEGGSNGIITGLAGTVGEHRQELLATNPGATSRRALEEAPDDQPLVAVQFRNNQKQYHYAMAALRPSITAETAAQFNVEYGELLAATKVPCKERKNLLILYKEQAGQALSTYGFQLERSVNSRDYPELFWLPPIKHEDTLMLFGNGVTGKRGSEVLSSLRKGGVYRRHSDYADPSRVIRIAALKIFDQNVNSFLRQVDERLKSYKFPSEVVTRKALSINNLSSDDARVQVERAVNELVEIPHDIVLVFLPTSDRNADNDDGGSLCHLIDSLLLRQQVACQIIYADTLNEVDDKQILNQVISGVLAKLGNLPYVLAELLEIADCFIGLDISRIPRQNGRGSMNACASVHLYGKRGEFISYQIEDAAIEGEEIPQRVLERLLPAAELEGKTILIYRDGRFCGREAEHLLKRAEAIKAKLILVECRKSGVPRLYNSSQKVLKAPELGLALRLSSREAIIVTTKVSDNVGLARPLRLTVLEQGYPAAIEKVVEATLKLTLLHHGALQIPRLPMPLFSADRIADLRLKGINPTSTLMRDRQFWL